jgi:hypothetical protein
MRDDLLRNHAELRTALILAGREIRKLNFRRKNTPVLTKLREILRDARRVAKQPTTRTEANQAHLYCERTDAHHP